jgi:hypothetical protein
MEVGEHQGCSHPWIAMFWDVLTHTTYTCSWFQSGFPMDRYLTMMVIGIQFLSGWEWLTLLFFSDHVCHLMGTKNPHPTFDSHPNLAWWA